MRACIVDGQTQSSHFLTKELKRVGFDPVLFFEPKKQIDTSFLNEPTLWLIDLEAKLELFVDLIKNPRQFVLGITRKKHLPTLELEWCFFQGKILGIIHRPLGATKTLNQLEAAAKELKRPSEIQLARERFFNYLGQGRLQDTKLTAEFLGTQLRGTPEQYLFKALVLDRLEKNSDAALVELDRALAIDPNHGISLKLKVDILGANRRYAESRPHITLLIERYDTDIQSLLTFMSLGLDWRDFHLAVQILETILRKKESLALIPWDEVGSMALKLGEAVLNSIKDEKLMLRLLEAISDLPISERKRVELCQLILDMGRTPDEAEQVLIAAPEDLGAIGYLMWGKIYYYHRNQRYRALEIWREGYKKTHSDVVFEALKKHYELMGLKFSLP